MTEINREEIVRFGDKLLTLPEVNSVWIKIDFKDGSNINYSKDKYELRRKGC